MLILILIDVQFSKKAGSNCQNHSCSASPHPIKNSHPNKISHPPTLYHYLENPAVCIYHMQ